MRHEPDVRSYAVTHPPGPLRVPQHEAWDTLIYACRGVLTVRAEEGSWVVPPHRAVWVPGALPHELLLSGRTSLRNLYVRREHALLPPHCRVIDVSRLLRELLLHVVRSAPLHLPHPEHGRLIGVLRDQLLLVSDAGLQLPMPSDGRVQGVVRMLQEDVADPRPLTVLADAARVSRRTLERVFLTETGMTLGQWRRRLRMLEALRLLAADEPVTSVALRVGYSTPSAFGAAFRAELGSAPGSWFGRPGQDAHAVTSDGVGSG